MKYIMVGLLLFGSVITHAQDPITSIIQQGIKKVIIAVDLKIQRLQNKTIWLQNAQKTIENELSKLRLTEIADWVEKQRKLYADYFDELWKVKNAIGYYHKVSDIISKEKMILKEYKDALSLFRRDQNFTGGEKAFMEKIYSGILKESLNHLDAVTLVIHAFITQMTDAGRMEIIDQADEAMDQNLAHIREFTKGNKLISMQRATEKGEVEAFKKIYGL
jgi:hypothetical protein